MSLIVGSRENHFKGRFIAERPFTLGYSSSSTANDDAFTANQLRLYPCILDNTFKLSTISIYVATAPASGNAILGVYSSSENMLPKRRISSFGEVNIATVGLKSITIDFRPPTEDLYYFAINTSAASTLNTYNLIASFPHFGSALLTDTIRGNALSYSQTYGSLPDPIVGTPTITDKKSPIFVSVRRNV